MTRRVLVSHRLPPLRSGNLEIDLWVEQYLQPHVSQVFEQLAFLTPESENFTPVVRGSGTAGTYELASSYGRYYKIGDLVFANLVITFAGAITAGGTGDLNITGLPFKKAQLVTGFLPQGVVRLSGIDTSTAVDVVCSFTDSASEVSTLAIHQTIDNGAAVVLPISAVAANDSIICTLVFEAGSRAA
jgi:hypothetical protein